MSITDQLSSNSRTTLPSESLHARDPEIVLQQLDKLEGLIREECNFKHPYVIPPILTVVIPVYNEAKTILSIVESVRAIPITKQIVIVDDGSTDGTVDQLEKIINDPDIDVFLHATNQGKGAALQTGFRMAEGCIVIVQDADLEYQPADILDVIKPILDGNAQVVYGSRYLNAAQNASDSRLHRFGNSLLTKMSNTVTGLQLTDMETCYKAFHRDLIQSFRIRQRRFGFEPEITAKIARRGISIVEVPIRYKGRSWQEGKKIGVKDLFNAIYCIFRYGWLD